MAANPAVTAAQVRNLVREQFPDEVEDVRPLTGGEFSRAFAFTAGGRAYVVRLSAAPHAAESFAKDAYAWRHFASQSLPIPRVVATGRTADGHFAISDRVAGRTLLEHAPAEQRALLPTTLDTLDAISRADVSASRGYGAWGADGQGRDASWHAFLAAVIENHTEGFHQNWHALFGTTFLEREVYEAVYRRMLRLAAHCPEERALLHNDYWYENILADGQCITGVIDWGNACYGDPLYDVAWLGWWFLKEGNLEAAALLRDRHQAAPQFAERIACYECRIGLDDLRFCAKTGRRAEYDQVRALLLARLAEDPRGD